MNLDAEIALAYRALARNDPEDAAEHCRRVLRERPNDPAALTLTGRLALASGEPDVAHDLFATVLRDHSRNAALWIDLALALRELNRFGEALDALRTSARLDARDRAVWIRIGELHLALNDLSNAADGFRRALGLDPRNVAAFQGLSQVERLELDSAMVGQFEALSTANRLDPAEQAQLHYALAHVHRRCDSKDGFIRHLFAANAQQRKTAADDARAQYEAMFDRLEAVFTSDLFEKLPRAEPIEPKPIFVVGMPRSGTTLVERVLAAHPDVVAGGEIDYMRRCLRRSIESMTGKPFPEGLDVLNRSELSSMAQAFGRRLRLMAPVATHVTDKTPGNFHLLGLLRVLFPAGHVIHVHRDPMDTCFSILQYPFDARSPHTCDVGLLAYAYARYVRLMQIWRDLFGSEFIEVAYEDLVADPVKVGSEMYHHCALSWRDEYIEASARSGPIRTFSSLQARQPIYRTSVGSWRDYAEALEPLRAALESELGRTIS